MLWKAQYIVQSYDDNNELQFSFENVWLNTAHIESIVESEDHENCVEVRMTSEDTFIVQYDEEGFPCEF